MDLIALTLLLSVNLEQKKLLISTLSLIVNSSVRVFSLLKFTITILTGLNQFGHKTYLMCKIIQNVKKTMEKKIRKNFELTKLNNGLVRVKMWSVGGDCYCQAVMFCTNQLWKVLAGNDTLADRCQLAHQVLSIGDIYTKTGILMPKTEKNIKWN